MSIARSLQEKCAHYFDELKQVEAKSLFCAAHDPKTLLPAKSHWLYHLNTVIKKLVAEPQITYKHFIPLYNLVRQSVLLSQQRHSLWDFFWGKSKTSSMQAAMHMVRVAANTVLLKQADKLTDRQGGDLIHTAISEKLFSEPRSNWHNVEPETCALLRNKAALMHRKDRHRRGIFTPPTVIFYAPDWPHDTLPYIRL